MAVVIAECCQNFNGNRDALKQMIWEAAEAGADYAKIQAIFADDLTHRPQFDSGLEQDGAILAIKRPYHVEFERLKKLEFGFQNYPWFVQECEAAGIKPLATCFTRNAVEALAKTGLRAIKISSYDCGSIAMLEDLKTYFNTFFVSTGASLDAEIESAAKALSRTDLTLLHCVTVYPTGLNDLHLRRIARLHRFANQVGFSDHTSRDLGNTACAVALMHGAMAVERHYSILPPDQTKDGPVSIDTATLSELCNLAHGTPAHVRQWVEDNVDADIGGMLGEADRTLSHVERLNRDYYRGRFASRDIDGRPVFNWESNERPLRMH